MASLRPAEGSSSSKTSGLGQVACTCTYERVLAADLPSVESLGYVLGKTLGSGTYAKVKAAWSSTDRELVAIKILNKSAASRDYLHKFLPREIENVQRISHFHLLQIHKIIETERQVFFVMDLAGNGDLLDYINARRIIPEAEAKYIFREIISGIQYLHRLNIAHRDLKCENIMLTNNMEVKIGDFGFSINLITSATGSCTPCGSYSYAAPELFNSNGNSYDAKKSDCWSMGVILYAMVCGRLPFGDDSQVKKQQKNGLSFPSSRTVSRSAKKLITGVLNPTVEERFDTYDIILHDWTASQPVKSPQPLNPKPKYTLENCLSLVYQTKIEQQPILPLLSQPSTGHSNMQSSSINARTSGTSNNRGTRIVDNINQSPAPSSQVDYHPSAQH